MAYTLAHKCAKNCCKRTILDYLIVEDVVTFFETQCRNAINRNKKQQLSKKGRRLTIACVSKTHTR